ncbi:MAG: hypothetical protein ABSE04_03855 [Candidatus Microgenomates bacterium]|jgi:Flp pilus assembly protein TadB
MKDEQMMGKHHGGGGHWLMTIGIVALVYGIMSWLVMSYMWAPYVGWIVGGIVLIIIGWMKKAMKRNMMEKM